MENCKKIIIISFILCMCLSGFAILGTLAGILWYGTAIAIRRDEGSTSGDQSVFFTFCFALFVTAVFIKYIFWICDGPFVVITEKINNKKVTNNNELLTPLEIDEV